MVSQTVWFVCVVQYLLEYLIDPRRYDFRIDSNLHFRLPNGQLFGMALCIVSLDARKRGRETSSGSFFENQATL